MTNGLGNRIKAARMKAGLSQKDVADYFEIKSQSVSQWESGKTDMNVSTLRKLAEFLKVSVDYLLDVHYPEPSLEMDMLKDPETKYNSSSPTQIEFLEMEVQFLLECKQQMKERLDAQSKLLAIYETGQLPERLPNKVKKHLSGK